jgi:hypothetical protein
MMSLIKTYKSLPIFTPSKLAYDYTGAKYGKLTVLHALGIEGAHTMWRAKCSCGTEVKVRSHQLANGVGRIDSCGKCQNLPRYNLPELPYTLVDDKQPEQKELPLETAIDELFESALELDASGHISDPTYQAFNIETKDVAAVPLTAWDVAKECCNMLEQLDRKELLKAMSLVKVQLGLLV